MELDPKDRARYYGNSITLQFAETPEGQLAIIKAHAGLDEKNKRFEAERRFHHGHKKTSVPSTVKPDLPRFL